MEAVRTKSLFEALAFVKSQSAQMKRHLEADQVMDGLKATSSLLGELRTSSLPPKDYYTLYMAVFDTLRVLSTFLRDIHVAGRHHLADVYELVQYSGACVPRLYLMITVGSVYMSIPDAPVKEVMKDILDMSRAVQHPVRGLFLRHYLGGETRDHLPKAVGLNSSGNIIDAITFLLTNFVEMNKLWIRLQHQGHSRDRDKREIERNELRILVGTNLVRLSAMDLTLDLYQNMVLPSILEQVVNCRDVLAQEYIMEVVIQVFSDEFHLKTLQLFLNATAQLHHKVNIKLIVIALVDRLAAYAAREADADALRTREQEAREADQAKASKPVSKDDKDGKTSQSSPPASDNQAKSRGIPKDLALFDVFWEQVVNLFQARPDLPLQDVLGLLVSMNNLSLSCYPERMQYVNQILDFAARKFSEFATNPELHHPVVGSHFLSLLLAPLQTYPSPLLVLRLQAYKFLLQAQPLHTRQAIAQAVVSSVLRNEVSLTTVAEVHGIFDLCHVLVSDLKVAPRATSASEPSQSNRGTTDRTQMPGEQGWVARVVHLIHVSDPSQQLELLQAAQSVLSTGGDRLRFTYPPLAFSAVKLASRIAAIKSRDAEHSSLLSLVFKFILQTITTLYNRVEASEIALRLYLNAASVALTARMEDVAYESFAQAFIVYEESISDSRAQLSALSSITTALYQTRGLSEEHYDALCSKTSVHASRMLKKNQQVQAILLASQLRWQVKIATDDDDVHLHRSGKRVSEALQKCLRIASSCVEEIMSIDLYLDTLDQYICFSLEKIPEIMIHDIAELVRLITNNISAQQKISQADDEGAASMSRSLSRQTTDKVFEPEISLRTVSSRFSTTLAYLRALQDTPDGSHLKALDISESMSVMHV